MLVYFCNSYIPSTTRFLVLVLCILSCVESLISVDFYLESRFTSFVQKNCRCHFCKGCTVTIDTRDNWPNLFWAWRVDQSSNLVAFSWYKTKFVVVVTAVLFTPSELVLTTQLRLAGHGDMVVSRSCTVHFDQGSFCSSAPYVWNDLPSELKNSDISRQGVKSSLKSRLFEHAARNRHLCELVFKRRYINLRFDWLVDWLIEKLERLHW